MTAPKVVQPATEVDDTVAEVALALFDHLEDQINRTDTKAQVVLAAEALRSSIRHALGRESVTNTRSPDRAAF
jgi:hypothetical protein